MLVILKPWCSYSWWTCLILFIMLFNFLFLIIILVANIMSWGMVLRKPMPLMCMRSQYRVNLSYLSRIPLETFGTLIGPTLWILWRTFWPLRVCHTGSIDILSHPGIFSKHWEVMQDIIINCVYDLLYLLYGGVLESPYTISPIYSTGSILFILLLHLWYWAELTIYHDAHVLIFEKVRIMVNC